MSIELTIPVVGESISEVSIGEWLKHEGDFVERDETVVVIETDKATVEIPAPQSGKLAKILKPSGNTAAVSEVIAYIDDEAGSKDGVKSAAATDREKSSQSDASEKSASNGAESQDRPSDDGDPEQRGGSAGAPPASHVDSADSIAAENKTTVTEAEARTDDDESAPAPPSDAQPSREAPTRSDFDPTPEADRSGESPRRGGAAPFRGRGPDDGGRREEVAVSMTQLRRRIAERLVQAQQSAALLTTFNEFDMSSVNALREKYREPFQQKYAAKLGFMSFFIKAAVEALALVPEVNAEIRGEQIVYRNFYDIGVAVGGGRGLVVPVLRNAERLGFSEIETAIADFARRAGENRLKPDELQGGTFTITNGGVYGSLLSTPIINPPQSGILGLHAIQERPVVRQGSVVARPMMYAALTYDHRIIDGREAVTFLKHIKTLIEDPARMLLQI